MKDNVGESARRRRGLPRDSSADLGLFLLKYPFLSHT